MEKQQAMAVITLLDEEANGEKKMVVSRDRKPIAMKPTVVASRIDGSRSMPLLWPRSIGLPSHGEYAVCNDPFEHSVFI